MTVPATCPSCSSPLDGSRRCQACGAAALAGEFRILRVIAQTSHGRTYAATGPDGVAVALKELVFALVPSVQQLEAFDREAGLLRTLQHPRIPRFVASFREGEGPALRLYLAQELVEGTSLAERLGEHRFQESEVVDLARQVLPILAWLHDRGIVHRDVKPANLVQRPDGTVVLVDFGAAREVLAGVTHGATLVGTFGYMPPEQLGGTVDASADVFAVGATLVHLLGRKAPSELLRQDLSLELSTLPCSPRTRTILARLLEPRREKRPRSAAEALALFDPPRTSSRRMLGYALLAAFTLAAGLVVLGVGGLVLFARSQEQALKARVAGMNEHKERVLDAEWNAEMGTPVPRAGQGQAADVRPASAREPQGVLTARGDVVAVNAVLSGGLLVRSEPPASPCWSEGSFELVSVNLPPDAADKGELPIATRLQTPPGCPPYPISVQAYDLTGDRLPVLRSFTGREGSLGESFRIPLGPGTVRLSVEAGKDPLETWDVLPRQRTVRLSGFAVPGSAEIPGATFEEAQGPGCIRWSDMRLGGAWVDRPAGGPDLVRLRAVFRKMERGSQDTCLTSAFSHGGLAVRLPDGSSAEARVLSSHPDFGSHTLDRVYQLELPQGPAVLLLGDPVHPLGTAELDLGARELRALQAQRAGP